MVSRKARYDTSSCLCSSNCACPVESPPVFHAFQASRKALGNLPTQNVCCGFRKPSSVVLLTMAVLNLSTDFGSLLLKTKNEEEKMSGEESVALLKKAVVSILVDIIREKMSGMNARSLKESLLDSRMKSVSLFRVKERNKFIPLRLRCYWLSIPD